MRAKGSERKALDYVPIHRQFDDVSFRVAQVRQQCIHGVFTHAHDWNLRYGASQIKMVSVHNEKAPCTIKCYPHATYNIQFIDNLVSR